MNIDFLETFLAIAETHSFSRASQKLHISQTTATARIKILERELNCRLFDHNAQNIKLTYAGIRLKKHAKEIVDIYHKGVFEIRNFNRFDQLITICASESIWQYYLLPAIIPHIFSISATSYQFMVRESPDTIAGVINGDIDIGITLVKNYHSEIECIPFFQEKFYLVCYPDLDIKDPFITPENIMNYPFIYTKWCDTFNEWYSKYYPHSYFLHLNQLSHLYYMLLNGYGMCFMPYRAAHKYLESGQLVSIPFYTGECSPTDIGNIIFLKRNRDKVLDLVSKILDENHYLPTVLP